MTKLSRICGGQPVETCPDASGRPADKWALLDALTHAASDFDLTHRTLGVLRALLSFFPDRRLPATTGGGVVYPSNRVLSDRLNGMPESTLRRHLAALVHAGLIDRHDSANRKRFARHGGVAFGFDLSPLARFADALYAAADRARMRQAHVQALRARIAAARQRLLDDGCDPADPVIEHARLALRRKLSPDLLHPIADRLETRLDHALNNRLTTAPETTPETCPETSRETHAEPPCPTAEMSATHTRNGRHIQTTDESNSVSRAARSNPDSPPPLSEVLDTCKEYLSFFPAPQADWPGLVSVAHRLHPMMGIDRHVFEEAGQSMGKEVAATVILCMLETLGTIHRPGAYLRGLSRRAEAGLLNMGGLLKAARKVRMTADTLVRGPGIAGQIVS